MDGLMLLSAILHRDSPSSLRDIREEFLVDEEVDVFHFINNYYVRSRELPAIDVVEEECDIDMPEANATIQHYMDRVLNRLTYSRIRAPFSALRESLMNEDMDEAIEQAERLYRASRRHEQQRSLFTLEQGMLSALERYDNDRMATLRGELTGIPSGYPYLDEMANGYQNGDLIIWAARTGMGKTYYLLIQAYRAWLRGANVLAIFMEMPLLQVSRRLMGIHTGVNPRYIRDARMQTRTELDVRASVQSILAEDSNRFNIFVGSFGRSTAEVQNLIADLSPDIILIDGIYLLHPSSAPKNIRRQDKLPILADELKEMTLSTNRPIICTHKYNRLSGKRGVNATEDNLGGADEFTTHASLIIGIKECPDDVDGYQSRRIEIQKGREGEEGHFYARYSFSPMDFDQTTVHEDIAESIDAESSRRVNLDFMGD